jgi:hypothetical protein
MNQPFFFFFCTAKLNTHKALKWFCTYNLILPFLKGNGGAVLA